TASNVHHLELQEIVALASPDGIKTGDPYDLVTCECRKELTATVVALVEQWRRRAHVLGIPAGHVEVVRDENQIAVLEAVHAGDELPPVDRPDQLDLIAPQQSELHAPGLQDRELAIHLPERPVACRRPFAASRVT